MSFSNEIEAFIKEFTKDVDAGNAAIFAGAGMSKASGFVDWPELLRDIAAELSLDIDREHDLISVAQFHVNQLKGSAKLARRIVEEFSHQAESSETHEILARLPIRTYWTTNYDTMIEDSLKRAYKVPDVKHQIEQLNTTRPKRDAVIYKMHGDVHHANGAVLYKEQYEQYYRSHAPFLTALMGDLVSKTFLFIGFSFTDPNLDYVLSRLHASTRRDHYCFMKKEQILSEDEEDVQRYKKRKQDLRVDDLKRYGIQTLLIDGYEDIPRILSSIESRYLKRTVFISGSAESYGSWGRQEALDFMHSLSASLVRANLRVVNGFGWGVGSAVINGALETIYSNPEKFSEDQLVMRPFPQFPTRDQDLNVLWEQYRHRMMALSGIAIFLFGNKVDAHGDIVPANGMLREFEIATGQGRIAVPVGATGFIAEQIATRVLSAPEAHYSGIEWIVPLIRKLADPAASRTELVNILIDLVQRLGR
ncbi:MAG: SIR2 family protein [Aquimonas sp.]|nr:SIR2 family protein [Aquimonas sp.]